MSTPSYVGSPRAYGTLIQAMILGIAGILLQGCVASSSLYTGRTLEEKEVVLAFGADDILLKSNDKDLTVEKGRPFAPSIGSAVGLPLRMEFGVRYYPLTFGELSLRHQLNPRSFEIFDCSANVHYGLLFGGYSYLKYGLSLSKNLSEYEPYVHYSAFHYMGSNAAIFDNSFVSGAIEEFINSNRIISFGIALPLQKKAKILPEVGYQYFGNDLSHGLWHFGLGLRIYLSRTPPPEDVH